MQPKIRRPAGMRRVLWILFVRSCTVCFVFVLSRLSPWQGVLIFPYVVVGWTLPTHRSTPARFCTSCCHFDGYFHFLLCLPSVCSVASYIQYLIHWFLLRTPFTRISLSFLNMAFSKAVFNMAFSKTLVYTHILFKLKPWFEQNQCFCVQTISKKRAVLHKNHVLAGPVHGLFAAYRIALSHGGRRNTPKAVKYQNIDTCVDSRTPPEKLIG